MWFDYAALRRATFDALNRVRADPRCLLPTLERRLAAFVPDGKTTAVEMWPGQVGEHRATEGAPAVREAIAFVRKQPAVPAVRYSPAIERAAMEHVWDLGAAGAAGHGGSDGSGPFERVSRHCTPGGFVSEVMACSPVDLTGMDIIAAYVVDDGVADRGHRGGIFNPAAAVCVGVGPHVFQQHMSVIDFASGATA